MRSFLLLLVASCCALAGPIKGPTEIKVDVGRLAAVPLEVDGDEIDYTILGGDYFGGFREFSDPKTFKFQVLGYANGTGFIVVASTKGGKLQPLFTVKVTVGTPTPPAPPVPPTPPAPPDDPEVMTLAAQIKAAASADAWHPANLEACAIAHRAATTVARKDTVANVQATLAKTLKDSLKGQRVAPSVQPIFANYLDAVLPKTAAYTLTDSDVAALKLRLETIAKACERAAK